MLLSFLLLTELGIYSSLSLHSTAEPDPPSLVTRKGGIWGGCAWSFMTARWSRSRPLMAEVYVWRSATPRMQRPLATIRVIWVGTDALISKTSGARTSRTYRAGWILALMLLSFLLPMEL